MRLIPLCLPATLYAAIKLAMEIGVINIGGDADTLALSQMDTQSNFFFLFVQRSKNTRTHTQTHCTHMCMLTQVLLCSNFSRLPDTSVICLWKLITWQPIIILRTEREFHTRYETHQSCAGNLFSCEIFNICLICLNGPIYKVCSVFQCLGGWRYCEHSSKSSSF